jgi:hypothetical protein
VVLRLCTSRDGTNWFACPPCARGVAQRPNALGEFPELALTGLENFSLVWSRNFVGSEGVARGPNPRFFGAENLALGRNRASLACFQQLARGFAASFYMSST